MYPGTGGVTGGGDGGKAAVGTSASSNGQRVSVQAAQAWECGRDAFTFKYIYSSSTVLQSTREDPYSPSGLTFPPYFLLLHYISEANALLSPPPSDSRIY